MSTFERIKILAKKYDMSLIEVNDKAHLGTRTIYHWKNKQPSSDKLSAVAKVLHTTTDYLNGLTDNPSVSIDKTEKTTVDIEKDPVVLSYGGKPISKEDMEIIKAIIKRHNWQKKE